MYLLANCMFSENGLPQRIMEYIIKCFTVNLYRGFIITSFHKGQQIYLLTPQPHRIFPIPMLTSFCITGSNLNKSGPWIYQKGKIMFHMTFPYSEACDSDKYSVLVLLQSKLSDSPPQGWRSPFAKSNKKKCDRQKLSDCRFIYARNNRLNIYTSPL